MKLLEALAWEGSERELALALDPDRIPAHIAIIMDGNGRWAKRRGLPRVAGHRAGVARVRSVVEDCSRLGVKALTLYAFSAENWKRPRAEVDMLWRLLRYYLRRELEDLHSLKTHLKDCLQSFREETERQKAESEAAMRALHRELERRSAHAAAVMPEDADPVTGLAREKAGIRAMQEAVMSGKRLHVVCMVVKGVQQ